MKLHEHKQEHGQKHKHGHEHERNIFIADCCNMGYYYIGIETLSLEKSSPNIGMKTPNVEHQVR